MNNIVKEVADLVLENEKLKASLQMQEIKSEFQEELKEGENAVLISTNQYNLFRKSLLSMVIYEYNFKRLDTGYGNAVSPYDKWRMDVIEKSKLPSNVSLDFIMDMIEPLLKQQYQILIRAYETEIENEKENKEEE